MVTLDFCISDIIRRFKFCGRLVNTKTHRKKYPCTCSPWKMLAAFVATMHSEEDIVYSADLLTGDLNIHTSQKILWVYLFSVSANCENMRK